jgi:23S rRNA pseudouridine2605 synthase
VFDLLGSVAEGLVAVGRLDLASSGLLLLTTDTRLAGWLTDPANAVPRRYVVTVRGELTDERARQLTAGVEVNATSGVAGRLRRGRRALGAGGTPGGERVGASAVEIVKRSRRESHALVTLTEGRNREIRRMCEAVGHEVTRLLRIAFGGIELGDLPAGAWREVGDAELARAFPGAPLRMLNADASVQ